MTTDVVIVGGGIVGCAIAYRLSKEKLSVTVVERGEVGRESSWAAGGILTPVHLAEYPTPLAGLCSASMKLYPKLIEEIRPLSSRDPEYRTTGLLLLVTDEEGARAAAALEEWKRAHDQPVERLTREEVLAREPGLTPRVREALLLPDIAQVRNHRMTAALADAARRNGVEFRTDCPVNGFLRVPGRVNGIRTPRGDIYAGTTVLAAGAWSAGCLRPLGFDLKVAPVKGQMLLVEGGPHFCRHVILEGDTYLVPRADGRILVGSTLEDAGFDKAVTVDGVHFLSGRAAAMMPGAAKLPIVMSWAGLRPSTPDRLPYVGRSPLEGLLVATGHFRNGILLAPVTAELIAELVRGIEPSIPLAPFDPAR